jgi:hypothetical protein
MSTHDDCECAEGSSNDSDGQQIAAGSEGGDGCLHATPPDSKTSEFLKAMYYWVLSRF